MASFSLALMAAEEVNLEERLSALQLPENAIPIQGIEEKFYAVQTRYVPLQGRFEFSLGGAKDFNTGGYTSSQQFDIGLNYYLTDRWFLSSGASFVANRFTDSAVYLLEKEGLIPDISVPTQRYDLQAGYHLFYGKFRVSMDTVFYFDQYVSLGTGYVVADAGDSFSLVGDIGLALWLGKRFSVRFGLEDFFYNEKRRLSTAYVHHLLGHASVGYLF